MNSKIGPILIGLSYLGLVVFIMIFCAKQSSDFAGYSQYWGLFGTLVGVATGAIPSSSSSRRPTMQRSKQTVPKQVQPRRPPRHSYMQQ